MNVDLLKRHLATVLAALSFIGTAAAEAHPLPTGYAPLEWIASSGTQYIKTGYIHKSNTRVECDIVVYRQGSWGAVFGACNQTSSKNSFAFFGRVGQGNVINLGRSCYARSGAETIGDFLPYEQRLRLVCEGKTATWCGLDDSSLAGSITTTGTADDGVNGLYIFTQNIASGAGDAPDTARYAMMKLFSFRIFEGENLLHDYVPCRNAEGEAGLWDLEEGVFLGNAGDGTFAGSDVTRPRLKLKWLNVPNGSWVSTDFKPNQDTRTVLDVDVRAAYEYWFGAWNVNYASGVYALCNNGENNIYSGYGNSGVVARNRRLEDGRHTIELDKNLVKLDEVTCYTFPQATFQVEVFLTLFAQNRKNENKVYSYGANRCRSAQIYDNGTLVRNFWPVLEPWGGVGFSDEANGGAFYGLSTPVGATWDLAYAETGTTLVAYVGRLVDDDFEGRSALEKNGEGDTLDVAEILQFNVPVAVNAGSVSFVNQSGKRHVFQNLTLKGDTALAFDVARDACDVIAPATLDLSSVTAEHPVRIIVTPFNLMDVGATPRVLIESGLTDADLAKFKLETGLEADLAVQNGALALVRASPAIRELPAGYTQLDWVRSTGLQYVKTGIDAAAETIVEMTFGRIRYAEESVFFGQGAFSDYNYLFNMKSNALVMHSTGVRVRESIESDADYRVWVGGGKIVLEDKVGGETTTAIENRVNDASPELAIFALNDGTHGGAFDFYAMKIADATGRLLRDFVPCRNPDGEAGLWDFVSREFFRNLGTERFFTADDVDVRLTRLQVAGGAYVNTEFVPNQNSRAVVDVIPNSTVECWFGAWQGNWTTGAFALSYNKNVFYVGFGAGYGPTAPAGLLDGARHVLELDKGIVKADGEPVHTCPGTTFNATYPLFFFAQNRAGSFGMDTTDQRVTCYSAQVYDNGTLVRDYRPFRQADGTMGMIDIAHGNQFYENEGFAGSSAYRMSWDGLAYTIDGTTLGVHEGTLTAKDVENYAEVRKLGWQALDARAVLSYPGALTLVKGLFSVKDNVAHRHEVAGALSIEAGAKLEIDVTPDGCDTFVAQSVTVLATPESPVEVKVNAAGVTELAAGAKREIFPGAAFSPADVTKFKVSGMPVQFAVEAGKLYLVPKQMGVAVWTGDAGDGKWSSALNWLGGELPEDGVTVLFDLAAGGDTSFDIPGGRSFKALVFGAGAGAFSIGGDERITVTEAITNLSSSVQTVAASVVFGVAGLPFDFACTGGNLEFKNAQNVPNADVLVKSGAGQLVLADTTLWSAKNMAVREGLLKTAYTGLVTAATPNDGVISIENDGMLDIDRDHGSASSIARTEPFHGKTVLLAGDGDGRGALFNSYPSANWGATFGKIVLAADAVVGGTMLRVQPLAGSRIPGSSVEGPHALTVKSTMFDPAKPGLIAGFSATAFALDRLDLKGCMCFEGDVTGSITNGVRLSHGAKLYFQAAQIPANCADIVVEEGEATLLCGNASTDESNVTVPSGTTLDMDFDGDVTFNGRVTVEGTLRNTGGGAVLLGGELAGNGVLSGGNIRFVGDNSCWRMTVGDEGFTTKADISGVTDPAFYDALKTIDIVYAGTGKKTFEIGPALALTAQTLNGITLVVKDANGEPVPNCWLWLEGNKVKLNLCDDGYIRSATWLGGTMGDVTDPGNWLCSNTVSEVGGRLPMYATVVTLPNGSAVAWTNGVNIACQQVNLPATLGGDTDLRGITARIHGKVDLKGHKLYLSKADGTATITDGEYVYLEWLHAPFGAFIDTKYLPTSSTRTTMKIKVGGKEENWFGSAGNNMSDWWRLKAYAVANNASGSTIYVGFGDTGIATAEGLPVDWIGTVELNQNVFTAVAEGETEPCRTSTSTMQTFSAERTMYLFANNTPGVSSRMKPNNNVTCYGCTVWGDASVAEPTLDFVPARRLSDGVVGMFERVNGKFYENDGDKSLLFEAGPPREALGGGEVHFDIPEGRVETNAGILFTGNVKVVKQGKGTLVATATGQTYSGGTVVAEGILKAQNTAYPCRGTGDVMTIDAGAALDINQTTLVNGASASCLYRLNGGTITNSGTVDCQSSAECQGLGHVELTADSFISLNTTFGFQNFRTGSTTLDMNGHTLTIDTGRGMLLFSCCTVTGGGKVVVTRANGVHFLVRALAASGTAFESMVDVVPWDVANHAVGDLTTEAPGTIGLQTGSLCIFGTYKPVTDVVNHFVMQDGSSFDLSDRSNTFDISNKTLTFADGAAMEVKLGKRSTSNRKAVIYWGTNQPKNWDRLDFKAPLGARYRVHKEEDGVYIESGLLLILR